MALVKSLSWGVVAFVLMLAVYFGVVSLVFKDERNAPWQPIPYAV